MVRADSRILWDLDDMAPNGGAKGVPITVHRLVPALRQLLAGERRPPAGGPVDEGGIWVTAFAKPDTVARLGGAGRVQSALDVVGGRLEMAHDR